MNANGTPIESGQFAELTARMDAGPFRTSELVDVAERIGFCRNAGTAQRVVEHVITKERRAGRVEMVNGKWQRAARKA